MKKEESCSARFSITANTASSPISAGHCGLHGLPSSHGWTGTMKPISAACSSGAMPFTFVKARRTVHFPFPLTNGLHLFLTAPKQKHQMIPIGIQLQLQLQPQQQQQPQPQQQPQQIVVICPRRASRPDNHSDRFLPRYFPNPPGNRFAHLLSGWKSRRRVDILVAPTGACAKPQSKLSPPPGSNFVVFSAAQCLY